MENKNVENKRRKRGRERESLTHYLADLGVGGSGGVDSIVFSGVLGINDAFLVCCRDATQVQAPEIHGYIYIYVARPFLRFGFQIKQRKKLISDTEKE